MSKEHLTEEAIQQYVLDKQQGDTASIEHMQQCPQCQAAAAMYQAMFSDIRQLPVETFGFDLSVAVLSQLPAARPGFSWGMFCIYLLVTAFLLSTGILFYHFHEYLQAFMSGITSILTSLGIITIVTLLICQVIDMYRKYRKKIDALDFQ